MSALSAAGSATSATDLTQAHDAPDAPATRTTDELWAEVRETLRTSVSEPVWMSCFSHLEALHIDDEWALLAAPSGMIRDRIHKRYMPMLHTAFEPLSLGPDDVRIEVHQRDAEPEDDPLANGVYDGHLNDALDASRNGLADGTDPADAGAGDADAAASRPARSKATKLVGPEGVRYDYTFDAFVTGSSNRFAQAAALAVAETPGVAYNPLFIHGDTGLGKTHLLHAIVNYLNRNSPELKVRYVSTETFLSEFIEALGDKKTTDFKRRYRDVDVLLLDDVQILQNKEALQEELFHTFNSLHVAGRQLVISSDRPPRNIATLSDRLRSRFEWGLITDIQPPDLETRVAILRKKEALLCARNGTAEAPAEVLEHIAYQINNNIRELEGALLRVFALSSLTGKPVTIELANESLEGTGYPQERVITSDLVLEMTSEVFGYNISEIVGANRQQALVLARQISMYVLREVTDLSYPAIAKVFGGRDHTTAIHAVRKIANLLPEDRRVYDRVAQLTARVRAA